MLTFFSILIMLMIGYAFLREGLFTGVAMCVNVVMSGLITFNFFEPLAKLMEGAFGGMFLAGCEDFISMILIFSICLGGLRTVTNYLMPAQIQFPAVLQRPGGFLLGMLTGYLTSGFLIASLQTLPWHRSFMFYDPGIEDTADGGMRKYLPPDRAWLALMFYAGAFPFSNDQDPSVSNPQSLYERYRTFDKYGTFIYRYTNYRRFTDGGDTGIYSGELNRELGR